MTAYVQYTTTATASQVKVVHCQWCNCEFSYVQTEQARAESSTGWWNFWRDHRAIASSAAQAKVSAALEQQAPSRCPSCGRFQTSMFRALRRQYAALHTWKPVAAAFVLAVLIGFFGPRRAKHGDFFESFLDRIFEFDHGWFVVIGATIAAIILVHVRAAWLDPNRDPERWGVSNGFPTSADRAARPAASSVNPSGALEPVVGASHTSGSVTTDELHTR